MAVVQISKIQLRRGNEQVDGIPQLSSGELAWAVDTQRLYIGNGSVSEGAPAVGNTRILTDTDNLLDIADQYTYKVNDPNIQTTANANYPIVRTLQERLDERVSTASYGIESNGTNQTANIQRAIDNLYLNASTKSDPTSRVTLEFLPGTYLISSTIYIPSYVRLVGAGVRKTIFQFTGTTTSVFEFINDTSTSLVRNGLSGITNINEPKHILMQGFTLQTGDATVQGFKLNAVRDSEFSDIEVTGTYGDSTVSQNSIGMGMYALSSVVTTQRNKFINVVFDGFTYGVYAKQDIYDNTFSGCRFVNCQYGLNFGTGANLSSAGEQYGPRKINILNSYFENVDRQGIIVSNGYGNKSRGNTFVNVGNDGGGNANNVYSQISFVSKGNSTSQDTFDRQRALSDGTYASTYLSEVAGVVHHETTEPQQVNLTTNFVAVRAFRLPLFKDTGFEINYVLSSGSFDQVRKGKLNVSVDLSTTSTQLTDDYEYAGTDGNAENVKFSCTIIGGALFIFYTNINASDVTLMTYTYRALS